MHFAGAEARRYLRQGSCGEAERRTRERCLALNTPSVEESPGTAPVRKGK